MLGKTSNIQQRRHPVLKILALVLIFGLLMTSGAGIVPYRVSASSTSAELEAAKAKQAALAAEKAELAKQNEALKNNVENLSDDLAWLNARSEEQRLLYEEKSLQLEAAVTAKEEAYAAYIAAEEDLADKQVQYAERVQNMFDHQNRSLLEVFIESDSLQGFFTTLQFMEIVADSDEQMLEDLEAAKDNAAMLRDQAKQQEVDMEAVVVQLEADLAKLKADTEATAADMDQAKLQLSEAEKAEDELAGESAAIQAMVAQLQSRLTEERKATAAAQAAAAAVSEKGWTWPSPGYPGIRSPYGMRMHPIYHYKRFHSGVDIGGAYGTPVVASRGGVIILVQSPRQGSNTGGSGYGNYIVIDHGDGFCSLYGHLKQTLVSEGQSVNAGDRIGLCGSTGASTGAHLHFEIWKDGDTVNPANYIG